MGIYVTERGLKAKQKAEIKHGWFKKRLREGQWIYKKNSTAWVIYEEPVITGNQVYTETDGLPQTMSTSALSCTHRAAL